MTDPKVTDRTRPDPPPTATYAEAYSRLHAIAERLKAPGSPAGIDTLAADIREARAAHAVCRERLDAIRREIEAQTNLVEPR